ncbi:MAG: hypothetical protein ACLQPD_23015 [Desulfomonilaceae bacterium]
MASNCQETTPYWSDTEYDYHVCKNCSRGYAIEPDKLRTGTPPARLKLCQRCQDIRDGKVTR